MRFLLLEKLEHGLSREVYQLETKVQNLHVSYKAMFKFKKCIQNLAAHYIWNTCENLSRLGYICEMQSAKRKQQETHLPTNKLLLQT